MLQGLISDKRQMLESLWPNYFEAWDKTVKEDLLDERELSGTSNPEFVAGLRDYVQAQEDVHEEERAARLTEEQQVRLVAEEIEFGKELGAQLESVQNIYWHLSLKATVEALYRSCWESPSPGTIYGLWDHQVR